MSRFYVIVRMLLPLASAPPALAESGRLRCDWVCQAATPAVILRVGRASGDRGIPSRFSESGERTALELPEWPEKDTGASKSAANLKAAEDRDPSSCSESRSPTGKSWAPNLAAA